MIDIKNKTQEQAQLLQSSKKLTAEGFKRRFLKTLKSYRVHQADEMKSSESVSKVLFVKKEDRREKKQRKCACFARV